MSSQDVRLNKTQESTDEEREKKARAPRACDVSVFRTSVDMTVSRPPDVAEIELLGDRIDVPHQEDPLRLAQEEGRIRLLELVSRPTRRLFTAIAKSYIHRDAASSTSHHTISEINAFECTFAGPARRKGPSRSYVTALESRVQRMETLLEELAPGVDFTDRIGEPIFPDYDPTRDESEVLGKRKSISSSAASPTSSSAPEWRRQSDEVGISASQITQVQAQETARITGTPSASASRAEDPSAEVQSSALQSSNDSARQSQQDSSTTDPPEEATGWYDQPPEKQFRHLTPPIAPLSPSIWNPAALSPAEYIPVQRPLDARLSTYASMGIPAASPSRANLSQPTATNEEHSAKGRRSEILEASPNAATKTQQTADVGNSGNLTSLDEVMQELDQYFR